MNIFYYIPFVSLVTGQDTKAANLLIPIRNEFNLVKTALGQARHMEKTFANSIIKLIFFYISMHILSLPSILPMTLHITISEIDKKIPKSEI